MANKAVLTFKTETSKSAFNKAYKAYLEARGDICCGRCRYNKGENRKHKGLKNWKRYRRVQYR